MNTEEQTIRILRRMPYADAVHYYYDWFLTPIRNCTLSEYLKDIGWSLDEFIDERIKLFRNGSIKDI